MGRNTILILSGSRTTNHMNEWLLILFLVVAEDTNTVTIGPMNEWTCNIAKGIITNSQVYVDEDYARLEDIKCEKVDTSHGE